MRRRTRLTGPAGCFRSPGIRGYCVVCGQRAVVMHMPIRAAGRYCPEHCPVCALRRRAGEVPEWAEKRSV